MITGDGLKSVFEVQELHQVKSSLVSNKLSKDSQYLLRSKSNTAFVLNPANININFLNKSEIDLGCHMFL